MEKETTAALVRRTLGEDAFRLTVVHYLVAEYVAPDGGCRATITLETSSGRQVVEGQGSGFVEAAFRGLMHHYARSFSSLEALAFTGFTIRGQIDAAEGRGLDAEVEVAIAVRTPHGRTLGFCARDRSTLAAAVAAVVQVVEYFINSERAYVKLHRCLADAEARHRPDLIEEYTRKLALLVETTSYEVISAQVRGG